MANLQSRVKKGKMTKEKLEKTFSLVKGTLDYSDFKSVDVVIEAVIENIELKQNIFADLVKYTSPDCVLTTNTSTIDINVVAAKTNVQDLVAGAHFFSYSSQDISSQLQLWTSERVDVSCRERYIFMVSLN